MRNEIFPGWSPLEVARHYGFPVEEYRGRGQTVALISLGGQIDKSVLKDEFTSLGIPLPSIREITLTSPPLEPGQNTVGSGETQMDIQVIGSICPEAVITVYRAAANAAGFAAAVQQAVDDRQSVISISWGSSEVTLEAHAAMESALEQAARQELTVCASAGDWGAKNARPEQGSNGPAADTKAQVEYPASSPWVLACGGTELISSDGESSEIAWNNFERKSGATGGGVSALFPLPEWQQRYGIHIPCVNTGRTGRVTPDVSALAAGGDWMIFNDFRPEVTGGTSAVAPLWAGFLTLVNEARGRLRRKRLGFVNPRLYALAATGEYFNDIRVGSNRSATDQPGYNAQRGFDACTGWGTPIGKKLFKALVEE